MRRRVLLAATAMLGIAAGVAMKLRADRDQGAPKPGPRQEAPPLGVNAAAMDGADAQWLENLHRRGAASLAEICDFLHDGKDALVHWARPLQDWQQFPTIRTELLAQLGDIRGSNAAPCVREVALSTSDPMELALAARVLEEVQPGQDRERLIAAGKQMLAQNPSNPAPLLQLLAFYGVGDAVPAIATVAHENWQAAESAVAALTLLRRQGGEAAILDLWRDADLPEGTRRLVAHAVGVCAADSEPAKAELQRMLAHDSTDPSFKQEALEGLAAGEVFVDPRLLPRDAAAVTLPSSGWLTARLSILESVEPAVRDPSTARNLQDVRDELLGELERTE